MAQAGGEDPGVSAQRFMERWHPAFEDLLRGKPARMIESFLVVDDKNSAMVVEFRLNGNQAFVHQEVFDPLRHWRDGLEVVMLKDRQATMTSFLQAVALVFILSFPNIRVVHVFQDDETGRQLRERLNLFWGRLDPWLLNHDGLRIAKSGDSEAELALTFEENGVLLGKSSYLVVSAGSREFGAGIPPNFVIFDEYDLYPNLGLVARIEAGKAPNCKTFRLSTPRGMRQLHADYWAAKEGRSGATAIALYSFQNAQNRMPEGDRLAPPAFRGHFELLGEHRRILESPEWEGRSAHREDPGAFFRWWEWKRQEIRQRLEAQGIYDEDRVLGEMEAEHCTSDERCWGNFGKSPFNQDVLFDYTAWGKQAQNRRRPDSLGVSGVSLFMWEPPQAGMAYACGMDCAEGEGLGDDAVAFIRDARGHYAASVRGRGRFSLALMTKALVGLLHEYGAGEWEPLFAPEVDGGLGLAVIEVAQTMGYRNFWRVPQKAGEDYDRYSLRKDEKTGWRTQGNKEDMLQRLTARLNNRDCLIQDLDFLRDASNYDPKTEKHTADNLMAAAITESITDGDHPKGFGRQFARMAAMVRSQSGGRAAAPARLRVMSGGLFGGGF